jgi:hypothetical protein
MRSEVLTVVRKTIWYWDLTQCTNVSEKCIACAFSAEVAMLGNGVTFTKSNLERMDGTWKHIE